MNNYLLFDMDGTLWSTVDVTQEASKIISEKYDYFNEVEKEVVISCMGKPFKEVAYEYMPYLNDETAALLLNELSVECRKLIEEKGGVLYPDVKEILPLLKKHFKLGIVTNNNDDYVKTFIKTTGLDIFDAYIGASSYGITKGEAIKKLIKDNNIDKCIFVGDTKYDQEAAKENNIPFVFAKYGFGKLDNKPTYFINEFKDLTHFLVK